MDFSRAISAIFGQLQVISVARSCVLMPIIGP